MLGSWNYITVRERGYYALLLVLLSGVIGVFIATDLFLLCVFWEVMLIPIYFIIGMWGGKNRLYAAVKFPAPSESSSRIEGRERGPRLG